jgi:hypothetical protein
MIVTLFLAAVAFLLGIGSRTRTPADEARSDLAATSHSGNLRP